MNCGGDVVVMDGLTPKMKQWISLKLNNTFMKM